MMHCNQCLASFDITERDREFYKKMDVPEPALCLFCRREHLFIWRNQRTLYSRTCDKTGKQIISIFSPDSPYTVYDRDYWWSDAWDPSEHGVDFDFTKTFAEQYDALLHRVPMVGIFNAKTENSQYCNHVGEMKDCYLAFASWADQRVLYADMSLDDEDSLDMLETGHSKRCYETIQITNCYNTNHSMKSERCNDSWFLFDCKDCSDCIGCTNLRNKQYYIFNEPHTLDEYLKKKEALRLNTRSGIDITRKQFETLRTQAIHRYASLIRSESCTGDNLVGAKNIHYSFGLRDDVQDSAYCINGAGKLTDVYDGYGVGYGVERGYFCLDTGLQSNDVFFGIVVWGCQYAYYNYNCHSSYEIFGCTGVRNKKWCILNKQYSQQEYETLKPKIIAHMRETGEWGNPLPPSLSPFGHNETLAHEYTPRTKEECSALGFKWQDRIPGTFGKETKNSGDIPETITETPDSITKEILTCGNCTKNYKIITQEFQFYRSKNLPIPLFCPQCRYDNRRALRNPHQLWHRQCMCELPGHDHGHRAEVAPELQQRRTKAGSRCPSEFETTYSPDRPERVFCEQCYQKEIL